MWSSSVALEIVHFVVVEAVENVLEAIRDGDSLGVEVLAAVVGAEDLVAPVGTGGVGEERLQGCAIGEGEGARAGGGDVSVGEIVGLDEFGSLRASLHVAGPADDHRDAVALFVGEPAFDPHAVGADHVAVVGGEGDQGAVGLAGFVERFEDASDLGVELLGVGVAVGGLWRTSSSVTAPPGLRFAAV